MADSRMPIETSSIHTNSVSARVLHPSRSEQIPGAGEIILGLEESESRRGRRDEQMYTDGITVNPVNNPSWLEHIAVLLSLNHSSASARADSLGRGKKWANSRGSIDTSIPRSHRRHHVRWEYLRAKTDFTLSARST